METKKWEKVFENLGFETYFFSGLSDWYPERSMVIPEAFFHHPEILEIQEESFGRTAWGEALTGKIQAKRKLLKEALYGFVLLPFP